MNDEKNAANGQDSETEPTTQPANAELPGLQSASEPEEAVPISSKPSIDFSVQDYLSLGYLYLLLLGIITQVVFYKLIGINILFYHGLFDVLLSPVVLMTRSMGIFVVFVLCLLVTWFLGRQLKSKKRKEPSLSDESADRWKGFVTENFFVIYGSILVFFMFVGSGIGAGLREAERLESGDFEPNHVLEFSDGEHEEVRIIGQNSQFIFYAIPGLGDVRVAPIEGNVRVIRSIADEREEEAKESVSDGVEKAPVKEVATDRTLGEGQGESSGKNTP